MRRREQLLITVDDGLPRLTEMKSMKSLKRGQWVTETGRWRRRNNSVHRKYSYDAAKNPIIAFHVRHSKHKMCVCVFVCLCDCLLMHLYSIVHISM